jgi:hypothetical protein|tara:strand:- start:780 stop:1328 length:549 start_codon:yes stop_codon:yes gene_type:complete
MVCADRFFRRSCIIGKIQDEISYAPSDEPSRRSKASHSQATKRHRCLNPFEIPPMPNNYNPNADPTQSATMSSKQLKRTVKAGPNKAMTKKGASSRIHPAVFHDPCRTAAPFPARISLRAHAHTPGILAHPRHPNLAPADGAGGKGTWGKMGAYEDASAALDRGDPNYDSSEEGGVVLEATG